MLPSLLTLDAGGSTGAHRQQLLNLAIVTTATVTIAIVTSATVTIAAVIVGAKTIATAELAVKPIASIIVAVARLAYLDTRSLEVATATSGHERIFPARQPPMVDPSASVLSPSVQRVIEHISVAPQLLMSVIE